MVRRHECVIIRRRLLTALTYRFDVCIFRLIYNRQTYGSVLGVHTNNNESAATTRNDNSSLMAFFPIIFTFSTRIEIQLFEKNKIIDFFSLSLSLSIFLFAELNRSDWT